MADLSKVLFERPYPMVPLIDGDQQRFGDQHRFGDQQRFPVTD